MLSFIKERVNHIVTQSGYIVLFILTYNIKRIRANARAYANVYKVRGFNMTEIVLFHKNTGLAVINGGGYCPTVSYVNREKVLITLPVNIVFATFSDGHSGALLVASEKPVLTSMAIYGYEYLQAKYKTIPYKSIGKIIQAFEHEEEI